MSNIIPLLNTLPTSIVPADVELFDPPMCCPTGLCGPALDQTLLDINEMIMTLGGNNVIIPKTANLMQSLALMKQCGLFVSNDSALMHLAAGLAIPQVAIFAYTNYNELYPWHNRHIIVRTELDCSPCFFNSPKPVNCILTGKDEFKYNDSFNHSTWLTFMKNRLEAARLMLKKEGVICVHVGNEEASYKQVLLDETFKRENYLNHITMSTNAASGFKATSAKIFSTANHIFLYANDINSCEINKIYVSK